MALARFLEDYPWHSFVFGPRLLLGKFGQSASYLYWLKSLYMEERQPFYVVIELNELSMVCSAARAVIAE